MNRHFIWFKISNILKFLKRYFLQRVTINLIDMVTASQTMIIWNVMYKAKQKIWLRMRFSRKFFPGNISKDVKNALTWLEKCYLARVICSTCNVFKVKQNNNYFLGKIWFMKGPISTRVRLYITICELSEKYFAHF